MSKRVEASHGQALEVGVLPWNASSRPGAGPSCTKEIQCRIVSELGSQLMRRAEQILVSQLTYQKLRLPHFAKFCLAAVELSHTS